MGDTLEHFRTGRRGVLRYLGENERCVIQFEDGKEEWRWLTAFVEVVDSLCKEVRRWQGGVEVVAWEHSLRIPWSLMAPWDEAMKLHQV